MYFEKFFITYDVTFQAMSLFKDVHTLHKIVKRNGKDKVQYLL